MTDLSALKELAKKATRGKRKRYYEGGGTHVVHLADDPDAEIAFTRGGSALSAGDSFEQAAADADLIAACSPEVILQLCEVVEKAPALIAAMAECQEIARRWEPDNSSGKERQWLVRGRDAAKALRSALADLEGAG